MKQNWKKYTDVNIHEP